MNVKTAGKMPLWTSITQLYGYIYCMILSSMLADGMPLYGGVLYLCGRAVIVFTGTVGKNRRFLPAYVKRWVILLLIVLLVIGLLLVGLFPATIESSKTWMLYAAVALCLCSEANIDRHEKVIHGSEPLSVRARIAGILLQAAITAGMSAILFYNFGWKKGWALAVGFLILVLNRVYVYYRLHGSVEQIDREAELGESDFRNAHAYHTVEWVSLLLVMAVELTITTVYALLAANREGLPGLLSAMALAVLCTVIPAEAGFLILRKTERKGTKDPTWLLCTGLILWLTGVVLCIQMLTAHKIDYARIYVGLVICTVGGSLSLTGLGRIEELMPQAVNASGNEVPRGYWKLRLTNWNLARLLGDVLALIALGIICRKGLPQTGEELAARFQPVMSVPVFLVVIGALVSAFRFPLSQRYITKIRKLMKLQEHGQENEALQREVARVVKEPYRQPYLSRFLIFLCRFHFRCRLVNQERVVTDDQNPLVFLCNHGEFYGPMACKIYIPVPIRAWTVSSMMNDKKSVAQYIYENTTSRQNMPEFAKRMLARLAAWLSVNVMGQLECIPVFRDSPLKLRETFRQTIEAMDTGDNIMIFPENPIQKYPQEGIGELSPGFVMLADVYWKRRGKRMRMLPMYADKKKRTITFGEIIEFNPENTLSAEQERIISETLRQIRTIAGTEKGEAVK